METRECFGCASGCQIFSFSFFSCNIYSNHVGIFTVCYLEIRRFQGMNHYGGYNAWKRTSAIATLFDFDQAQSVRPKGHCVTVRVTSEDPDDGFKETGGKVQELSFKSKPNAWAYFSVKSGGGIHELSDSQLGHAFAFGESGALAIANMVLGLKEIQIWGEIYTNVDFTIDLLNVLEYQEKKIHTGWLDSRIALQVRAERLPMHLSVVGGALYHISLVNSQVLLNIEGSKYKVLHPVSDYLVEVNLPTIQVIVGMGISLWQIPARTIDQEFFVMGIQNV